MSEFLDKHPKFAAFIGDAGKVLSPVLSIASNVPGLQCLATVSKAIDNLEGMSEEQKTQAKEILKTEMAANDELEGLIFKDMADARNREVVISTSDKAPLINKITLPVLAAFITFGFFGLLAYMCKWEVPPSNKDIINIMIGSLGTAWIGVVSYYFGSSSGSKDKDAQINNLINKSN